MFEYSVRDLEKLDKHTCLFRDPQMQLVLIQPSLCSQLEHKP